jgi:chromosome segregation ATPase
MSKHAAEEIGIVVSGDDSDDDEVADLEARVKAKQAVIEANDAIIKQLKKEIEVYDIKLKAIQEDNAQADAVIAAGTQLNHELKAQLARLKAEPVVLPKK